MLAVTFRSRYHEGLVVEERVQSKAICVLIVYAKLTGKITMSKLNNLKTQITNQTILLYCSTNTY